MWCDGALLNAGDIHVWHLWCDVRNRTFGMSFGLVWTCINAGALTDM